MARTRGCNDYIPEELIFDILSRLPVKSLFRFKSVCKLWLFIISDTRFVQTHLANSHKKQAVLLNYRHWRSRPEKYIEVHDTYQDFVKLYLPPHVTGIAFINSCDGLVCLSNYNTSVIYIWNPSTKRLMLLPTSENQLCRWPHVHIGLGFDSICNEYKLLRIMFKDTEEDGCTAESELYSANAGSWKKLQIPKRLQPLYLPFMSKLVSAKSGVLYMAIEPKLLAFDLHNEVFRLYPFPNFEHSVRSDVLDYEGYVSMIFQGSNGSTLSLYMLDDVCGKVSWTKMFNLEADIKIDWVVRYLGFGQFIAHNYVAHCVFNYDYRKGETKKCLLELSDSGMCSPVKYTESLVSLNGFEQV